jgi:hypothetical protein
MRKNRLSFPQNVDKIYKQLIINTIELSTKTTDFVDNFI